MGVGARSGAARLAVARPTVAVPRHVVRASSSGGDFDDILMTLANKFEKAENKPVVIAYISAAAFAIFFSEWLIHLPALNVLLGFPIQLLGLLALPYLGVRYLIDGGDVSKDAEAYASTITKKLPGLEKK
ncbi:tRNA-dihydrouridine synthase [Raphidocelis subcapitata]|uniref:tRNA-dihydrouridine synthase n=1 Tax=Raphidocelis subcapitata TaxID=307507 RepID=A0A2V0NP63_9CHLO|nr:tRNA-dihydrouridine synthase [Raphidocelis subcapitata]|eukprot:GBF87293.1 tRNA-dihydrouridine synthase [Raphidocelis subcapitata]